MLTLENPLAALAELPMFNQLRAAVQQNPMLLQAVLSQLAQTNPQLFQLISQNQEAFLKLLTEGGDGRLLKMSNNKIYSLVFKLVQVQVLVLEGKQE